MFAALAALALVWLAGCAVPLAPGYEVQKQSLSVHYIAGSPAHLAVRADFQLRNVGNSELNMIDVALPDEAHFGLRNLRVQLEGRAVSLQPGSPADVEREDEGPPGGIWRIPFDPPWPRRQKRALVIEYDLAPALPGDADVAVGDESFHLRALDWFPELQAPKKLFAHDVVRPDSVPVNIFVPADFLVASTGISAGVRKQVGEAESQFALHKFDLDPFVVAGRYREEQINASGETIFFWTFGVLPSDAARAAGARIAATVKTYETDFGSIAQKPVPIRLVETPAQLRARSPNGEGPAGRAFPGGVLLNRAAIALGVDSDEFLAIAEHELAHTWLGEQVELRPEAEIGMGEGFAEYAPIVAAEAREGEAARRQAVARWLQRYDQARPHAVEKTLWAITKEDPWEQRRIAFAKGTLFFIALEDECGETGARRGIAHLVSALRGEQAGFEDLRSALELETGKDLAAFFRVWLGEKGIPTEFRNRYEVKK